ncbi:MAG: 5-oxoprolinase subunit PxpB [Solobacterium sp.]|nr:5-oxoprolinase subunit PxpB [Solobacterium sp.]
MKEYEILPCGDTAVLIRFEQKIDPAILRQVTMMANAIKEAEIKGILDLIPAYASILVCIDPLKTDMRSIIAEIEKLKPEKQSEKEEQRMIRIPVLYGRPFAEDLEHVAKHAGISIEEVIRIHTANTYPVYMIGFLPGFPYLGNLDERIHTPRRTEPRTDIPAGAVGIGGSQTGVYPISSPGGWHIIGQTPVKLYDSDQKQPVLLQSGDLIQFYAINEDEYEKIEKAGGKLCL